MRGAWTTFYGRVAKLGAVPLRCLNLLRHPRRARVSLGIIVGTSGRKSYSRSPKNTPNGGCHAILYRIPFKKQDRVFSVGDTAGEHPARVMKRRCLIPHFTNLSNLSTVAFLLLLFLNITLVLFEMRNKLAIGEVSPLPSLYLLPYHGFLL